MGRRAFAFSVVVAAACGGGGHGMKPIDAAVEPPIDAHVDAPPPDVTPPMFAGALAVTPITNTEVAVSWAAAHDDRTAAAAIVYHVWQASAAGGEVLAGPATIDTAAGALVANVGGLTQGQTYFFVVRAEDAAGNVDGNVIEASGSPAPDTTAPVFGGVTAAVALSPSAIRLDWTEATDDFTPAAQIAYDVYDAASLVTPVKTVIGTATVKLSGLTPVTSYSYVVRARDLAGNEDANTVSMGAMTGATTVSFAADVMPIFSGCTNTLCHGGAAPAEGLNLSTRSLALAGLVNHPPAECSGMPVLVDPGSPDASYLIWKLNFASTPPGLCVGGVRMPKMMPPLAPSKMDTIRTWIAEGALDD